MNWVSWSLEIRVPLDLKLTSLISYNHFFTYSLFFSYKHNFFLNSSWKNRAKLLEKIKRIENGAKWLRFPKRLCLNWSCEQKKLNGAGIAAINWYSEMGQQLNSKGTRKHCRRRRRPIAPFSGDWSATCCGIQRKVLV